MSELYTVQEHKDSGSCDTSDDWWEVVNCESGCVVALVETKTMADHVAKIPEYVAAAKQLAELQEKVRLSARSFKISQPILGEAIVCLAAEKLPEEEPENVG